MHIMSKHLAIPGSYRIANTTETLRPQKKISRRQNKAALLQYLVATRKLVATRTCSTGKPGRRHCVPVASTTPPVQHLSDRYLFHGYMLVDRNFVLVSLQIA